MISVYPVFLLHNKSRLRRWPAEVQHIYFIFTGMCIAFWTLGGKIQRTFLEAGTAVSLSTHLNPNYIPKSIKPTNIGVIDIILHILARCVLHNLICVVVNYVVLKVFGGTLNVTAALFAFQLCYLSVGKYNCINFSILSSYYRNKYAFMLMTFTNFNGKVIL